MNQERIDFFKEMFKDVTDEELQRQAASDIMEACIAAQDEMKKRQEKALLAKYAIWQDSGGRWRTYIGHGKERKQLSRMSRDDLLKELAIIEGDVEESEITFEDCYQRWRENDDYHVDNNTVSKRNSDWIRFFKGTDISTKPIVKISEKELFLFMKETICHPKRHGEPSDVPLCKRSAKQFWGYIGHVFSQAEEDEILTPDKNPARKIIVKNLYKNCVENVRPDNRVIVPPNEMEMLQNQIRIDHEEHPEYMAPYALELAMLTGMRAGEIAGLRWERVMEDEGYIYVTERASVDQMTGERRQKPPKNLKSRRIPLTFEMKEIFERVREVAKENGFYGDYVFQNENGPLTAHMISSCLKNRCKMLNITTKGVHAFRRTVNSIMRANGLDAQATSSILGNTVGVNNTYYTFDVRNYGEKLAALEEAGRQIRGNKK